MTRPVSSTALQRLKTQRDKLNARIRQTEMIDKARQRKQDLQRKILVGSYILEQAHRDGRYTELVEQLEGYLTRDNDRQLFALPARGQGDPKQDQIEATSDTTYSKTATLATVATNTAKG